MYSIRLYTSRQNGLKMKIAPSDDVKFILIDKFENSNLTMNNLTTRINELMFWIFLH